MNLYNEKSLFKGFLKDSDNYHKYYDNIISLNQFQRRVNSPLPDSLFKTRIKFYNNKNNSNDSNSSIKELISEPINKIVNSDTINNIILNPKIKLKPILSKRKLNYNNILNMSNSPLSPKFSRNIKLLPIKQNSLKNLIVSPSNLEKRKIRKLKFNRHKINFFNDYEKDFFLGIDYSNLKYNEYEIYKDKSVYEKLIKERIIYFKNNTVKNKTVQLKKAFHYGKNNKEIKLTLDTLTITLRDMSLPDNIKDRYIQFKFPFSLLPIFYYKGYDTFMEFLSLVIKVENNFEKIIFEEDKIIEALNSIQDFKIENEEKEEEKKEEKKENNFDYLEFYKEFYKSNKKKPRQENIIELRPIILKKRKNFLKFNYFIFFWTTNLKTFIVTITMSCIHLKIVENNIEINNFIDYELLFYLYKRNFLNWEYFIIKNLSGYTKFRNIFQQIESFKKIYDKKIFLREPKTRKNTFVEETLTNVYTDQFNKNQIAEFKSFYCIVSLVDMISDRSKIYYIYFNFRDYVKLYEMSNYSSKIMFLIQFLEINSELNSLNFNFIAYAEFKTDIWMHNIKKYSHERINNNKIVNENLIEEFIFFGKKIIFEFKRPSWTIFKKDGTEIIKKTWEIGKELEKELVESILGSNSESWTNLLNGCLEKLNEPVPVLPRNKTKRKKIKKKIFYRTNTILSNKSSSSSKRRSNY